MTTPRPCQLLLLALISLGLPARAQTAEAPSPVPPAQDQGLPYTRSSARSAIARVADGVALYPGSRYACVLGRRVRLSDTDLLRAEARLDASGRLFVPAEFADIAARAAAGKLAFPPVPADLAPIAGRWVYAPSDLGPVSERVGEWTELSPALAARGWTLAPHPAGFWYAGPAPLVFAPGEDALIESIVTLFDTPEKFADPDIATRRLPALAAQGKWTDHVKVTPAQLAALEGPATEWPTTPRSAYDEAGIARSLFGSPLPAPGIYPRLLLSPEDIPAFSARVKNSVVGRMSLIEMEHLFAKTWWDPATSDGRVFQKLSTGDLAGLEWDTPAGALPFAAPHVFKGQKPGITNSHVPYVPECLTAMGLYALIQQDDALGRRVAAAFANYYRLREPLLDGFLAVSDSEWASSVVLPDGSLIPGKGMGAATHWRSIHGLVGNTVLGPGLDFAGRWMNAEEKDLMRRVIAKATYGRRSYGQDGPARFRDVNWMTWDTPHFLALSAIEGLPGFDREAWAAGAESLRAFCEWGIDPAGVVYESNGKSPGSFGAYFMSLVSLARRGENLFAHPHLRRLPEAQALMTSPNGVTIVNSGTQYVPHSRQHLSPGLLLQLKSIYPQNRAIDYLLTEAASSGSTGPNPLDRDSAAIVPSQSASFDAETYRAAVAKMKRLRLPSMTYPGFVRNVLFDSDFTPTTRAEAGLPLELATPVHGVFSAYSDATPEAAWINLQVRPNHYLGAGHHHADAGMFHFSALGVDWITESAFAENYSGNFHNLVLVDGKSQPEAIPGVINGYNAAATWLGSSSTPALASAYADLAYAYSWRWNTQPPAVWSEATRALAWEMDPTPRIAQLFAGTARLKMRPWWANYTQSNFIATSRAPYNPMERVFRKVALVRGARPYGIVVDDVKKDDRERLYQWTAMLGGAVVRADLPGLPENAIALASAAGDVDISSPEPRPVASPRPGDALLLVYSLGHDEGARESWSVERVSAPRNRKGDLGYSDRLVAGLRAKEAAFRILLVPSRAGEALPELSYDPARNQLAVVLEGQRDLLALPLVPEGPVIRLLDHEVVRRAHIP